MKAKWLVTLFLLTAPGLSQTTSTFRLGVDFSQPIAPNVTQMGIDTSGALYLLSGTVFMKLSADGKSIVSQKDAGVAVNTMAVDPTGGVFFIPTRQSGDASTFVIKLGGWKAPVASVMPGYPAALAADSLGRAYVAAACDASNQVACVVRLNASGDGVEYTARVKGTVSSIAVNAAGEAFVAGYDTTSAFVAQIRADGTAGFYSTTIVRTSPTDSATVAIDAAGFAVALHTSLVNGTGVLERFDATGAVVHSQTIRSIVPLDHPNLAVDAAGNAYVTGSTFQLLPVKNTLATCGSDWLSVIAPDGEILQTTYLPGGSGTHLGSPIAMGPGSTLYFETTGGVLFRLSPAAPAPKIPLACVGNAASFSTGPIAPGEIVTLFGEGFGTSAEVTFDGKAVAPMWAADTQINVVAPVSLTPGSSTQVCVESNCLSVPVLAVAPGVFTTDGIHAAALNEDGSINSPDHPAPPGSLLTVFATGLGASLQTVGVVALSVGVSGPTSTPLEVTYAGPARDPIDGVSQINFRIGRSGGPLSIRMTSGLFGNFRVYVGNLAAGLQ